ncbi:MAG TPA: OmpA family protein [Polyangia bacterium]|nr:OmpA family protein [Polyangia bacterium]
MRLDRRRLAILTVLSLLFLGAATAQAQSSTPTNNGFAINRYEPTPAGEASFAVDHPWYSAIRLFAGGVTLNYANKPFVFGPRSNDDHVVDKQIAVIGHQFLLHVDLAASFVNRVTFSASLPVVLLERGTLVEGVGPIQGGSLGDPRFGAMVRLYGNPEASAFSVNLGAYIWVPLRLDSDHVGDRSIRVLPKLVLAGLKHRVRWSFTSGFYYRAQAKLSYRPAQPGNSIGSQLQLGASIYYADPRRFSIGPEAIFTTTVIGGCPFCVDYAGLELLLAAHYNIAKQVMVGVAGGIGLLREPGTPEYRLLFRLAYAPFRRPAAPPPPPQDTDEDGIPDAEDRCPFKKGVPAPGTKLHGCPPPPPDSDKDGIIDNDDRCPDVPQGEHPDPERLGCPDGDDDQDGVLNHEDECRAEPAGPHPDPKRRGCPAGDADQDKVTDDVDQCLTVPAGLHPDPDKPGCPLPDRDEDSVVDKEDACPDQPGAPDPNPKKNGCPGLVQIKGGAIRILKPVYFATNKDVILSRSFPVLQAVANVLIAQPEIRRISIEGHTDNRGKPTWNRELSDRRAKSVQRWLIAHGINPERLGAQGFGPDRPITTNATDAGRSQNRRVEFRIVDPPPVEALTP